MAPADLSYCPAHSDMMLLIGQVKANQESVKSDIAEIKAILAAQHKKELNGAGRQAELRFKTNVMWGGIGTAFIALVSFVTSYLVKKICG